MAVKLELSYNFNILLSKMCTFGYEEDMNRLSLHIDQNKSIFKELSNKQHKTSKCCCKTIKYK